MHRISAALLGAFVGALAAGCMADTGGESILVLKNVHAGTDCLAAAAENEIGTARGTLDLLMPSGYVFVAQLKSRIETQVEEDKDKDQRTIFTTGANVDISFPGSDLFSAAELTELRDAGLTRFKQPFVAPIVPNGGLVDIPFVAVPEALVDRIAARADLSTKFRLETLVTFTIKGDVSGREVSSQPFSYAITIGNGVVVNVMGSCSSIAASTEVRTGYACNPAQDGVIDCCVNGTALMCPAVVPSTAP